MVGWIFTLPLIGGEVSQERLGFRIGDEEKVPNAPFLPIVPDWICEIVTPSTAGLGTFADDEKVRAVPFDAIELELNALWL